MDTPCQSLLHRVSGTALSQSAWMARVRFVAVELLWSELKAEGDRQHSVKNLDLLETGCMRTKSCHLENECELSLELGAHASTCNQRHHCHAYEVLGTDTTSLMSKGKRQAGRLTRSPMV